MIIDHTHSPLLVEFCICTSTHWLNTKLAVLLALHVHIPASAGVTCMGEGEDEGACYGRVSIGTCTIVLLILSQVSKGKERPPYTMQHVMLHRITVEVLFHA